MPRRRATKGCRTERREWCPPASAHGKTGNRGLRAHQPGDPQPIRSSPERNSSITQTDITAESHSVLIRRSYSVNEPLIQCFWAAYPVPLVRRGLSFWYKVCWAVGVWWRACQPEPWRFSLSQPYIQESFDMWNTYERVFVAEYQQYKKIKVQKFAYV